MSQCEKTCHIQQVCFQKDKPHSQPRVAKVNCSKSTKPTSPTYSPEPSKAEYDYVFSVSAGPMNLIIITLLLDQVPIPLKFDTDASVSLISKCKLTQLWPNVKCLPTVSPSANVKVYE